MSHSFRKNLRRLFGLKVPSEKRRCVITGIGVVSPVGIGKDEFFTNLLAGATGAGPITKFDASNFSNNIAAEIKGFDPTKFMKKTQAKYLSLGSQYACAAFKLAAQDAKMDYFDPFRTDVIIGGASSGLDVMSETFFSEKADTRQLQLDVTPVSMIRAFMNAPASAVAFMAQTKGYVTTVSSACASALNAVGLGRDRVLSGKCDIAIVGGVDAPINPIVMNGYNAAHFLTENDDPLSLRPFDKRHEKAILGEGSAIFIVEELQSALDRGARIYGEITAFCQSNENMNIIFSMDESGERWAQTIERALQERSGKKTVDYINAHGPSDKSIDNTELRALRLCFGDYIEKITITSIKGAVGSGMSSAGAFQIASALLTLLTGKIPPSVNFEVSDEEFASIKVSHNQEQKKRIRSVLVNGHALGGTNASLIIEEYRP